ncbi:hypothetical protein GA0115255_111204 [Streptomyces sp. Ncost-T6T-2b]|nr:hypothetical protein GA0115255_111204 [Streptomyces sp. Ncost-T6T-2b]
MDPVKIRRTRPRVGGSPLTAPVAVSSSAASSAVASARASSPDRRNVIRPEVRTVSVRAHATARAGLGETSRTAMPSAASVVTNASICRTSTGARPSVGSSSSSTRGEPSRARASASICCSPPDRSVPRLPRRSPSRGSSSRTRAGVHTLGRVVSPRRGGRWDSRRCSSTVSPANTRRPCGTRPIPARAIRCAGCPVTSRPSRRTVPALGRISPATVWTSVVLPAPLWPTTAWTVPAGTDRSRPCRTVPPW